MKLHEFMNIIMYYCKKFKPDGSKSLLYDGTSSIFDYVLSLIIIPALFIIHKRFMIEISKSN